MRPTRVQQNLTGTIAGLLAVGALAGCGGAPSAEVPDEAPAPTTAEEAPAEAAADTGDFRTGPIPSSAPRFDESELPPEPAAGASPTEQIEYELLAETTTFAQAADPAATAECPETDAAAQETITCTVTYQGLEVPWSVDISGSEFVFSFEPRAEQQPISRDIAEDALRWYADTEAVLCDMEEYLLVAPDGDTDVTCQAQGSGGVETFAMETGTYGTFSFTSS
ncbi:hypothetical protein ACFOVU_06620 [Nocardiopsis sediminis]|uniref:Ig-like domain-containing protein n=1 Tax=Nocardiopsis sediminis TaxID=1778267 RepID=A0ABV8FKI7_9ACTN